MATQIIDGVKAPSGGFQQGGWYEGRQYWNGTLSAPGVINSQSDQVGAGKAVSAEVNRATSIAAGKAPDANQKYIAQETAKLAAKQTTKAAVSSPAFDINAYLGDYQSNQYNASAGDLMTNLTGGTEAPATINRVAMLEEQRTAYDVASTEAELNAIKEEERTIQADMRAKQSSEEGKTVALGVISGRVTEEQRQAQTELDYLNVRKATVVDELNTKYNVINTYINYAGLDYQDAVKAYDSAFDKNLQVQTFLSNEKQNATTNARANLTTIMNAITSGNMSYDTISNDEKLAIQKLEMQSGLPVGTVSNLKMSDSDSILGWSDDKSQVIIQNADGGFSVRDTGIKPSGNSNASGEIVATFNNIKGTDGYVDPQDYKDMKSYFVSVSGKSSKEFDDQFASTYVNPKSYQNYGVSLEYINPDAYKKDPNSF